MATALRPAARLTTSMSPWPLGIVDGPPSLTGQGSHGCAVVAGSPTFEPNLIVKGNAARDAVTMKAISYTEFGSPDVLRVTETDRPALGNRDVLIRVFATTVKSAECGMRRGEPRWGRVILGFTVPRRRMRVLGTEIAGIVETVGRDVTRFHPR